MKAEINETTDASEATVVGKILHTGKTTLFLTDDSTHQAMSSIPRNIWQEAQRRTGEAVTPLL